VPYTGAVASSRPAPSTVFRLTCAAACALLGLTTVTTAAGQTPAQKFTPTAIKTSDIQVRIDSAGRIPSKINPTSPVVAGPDLLLVDQGGFIYRWNGDQTTPLLSRQTAPAGLKPLEHEGVLNVAANAAGSKVYVVFLSSNTPRGIPQRRSVRDQSDAWYVLYEYDFDRVRLSNPRPIVALEARSDGHTGGGLAVSADGSVLFAVADNGDSYEDGHDYSQSTSNHLAKILKISPADGAVAVVAVGVRSAQRLALYGTGADARLDFIDDGGWVAEELNSVLVSDLTSTMPVNFGWGRNAADGHSREGTFYIDKIGNSIERIAGPEREFASPIAEFGREGAAPVAASGPVSSTQSFSRVTSLFGDLVSGSVLAVSGSLATRGQAVFRVSLLDSQGRTTTLKALTAGMRPDPRFFNFPDGSAGVLLEATGEFYRLTEVAPAR